MTFTHSKTVATAAWVLAVAITAWITRPSTTVNVTLLTAIAVAGFLVLGWFWRRPELTMSESIQNARR